MMTYIVGVIEELVVLFLRKYDFFGVRLETV